MAGKASSTRAQSPDLFSLEDGSEVQTPQSKASPIRASQSESGLRIALREALEAQEHYKQKAQTFSEALLRETRRSDRLQHEKDQLLSAYEKLHEKSNLFQAEFEELRSQKANLESRNVLLQQELKRSAHSSPHTTPSYQAIEGKEAGTVLQYLALVQERLEACPELRTLYRGRVPVSVDLRVAVGSGDCESVLVKVLQVMSDFVAFHSDFRPRKEVEESVEKLATGTQTTLDRSIATEKPINHFLPSADISSSLDSKASSSREQHLHIVSSLNRHSSRLDQLTQQLAASQLLLRTQRPYYDASFSQHSSPQEAGSGRARRTGYHSSKLV